LNRSEGGIWCKRGPPLVSRGRSGPVGAISSAPGPSLRTREFKAVCGDQPAVASTYPGHRRLSSFEVDGIVVEAFRQPGTPARSSLRQTCNSLQSDTNGAEDAASVEWPTPGAPINESVTVTVTVHGHSHSHSPDHSPQSQHSSAMCTFPGLEGCVEGAEPKAG
jgi:hypothetical protein